MAIGRVPASMPQQQKILQAIRERSAICCTHCNKPVESVKVTFSNIHNMYEIEVHCHNATEQILLSKAEALLFVQSNNNTDLYVFTDWSK